MVHNESRGMRYTCDVKIKGERHTVDDDVALVRSPQRIVVSRLAAAVDCRQLGRQSCDRGVTVQAAETRHHATARLPRSAISTVTQCRESRLLTGTSRTDVRHQAADFAERQRRHRRGRRTA